jgi:uncharacterized cupin superfamily protein
MSYIVYEDQIKAEELPGRSLKWLFTPRTAQQPQNFTMNIVNIKPGNTVKPAHAHPKHEEIIYIVSGSGFVHIDGSVSEIRSGTAILFSPGSIHMLRNSGSVDMQVVCFFTPAATMDDYTFYPEIDF